MRQHFFPEAEDAEERELFERAARWDGPPGLDALTPELLRELTAREGCDFATTLLHRCIVESELHGPFLRGLPEAGPEQAPHREKIRVAIVPGAFYRETRARALMGAFRAKWRNGWGCPWSLPPFREPAGWRKTPASSRSGCRPSQGMPR